MIQDFYESINAALSYIGKITLHSTEMLSGVLLVISHINYLDNTQAILNAILNLLNGSISDAQKQFLNS